MFTLASAVMSRDFFFSTGFEASGKAIDTNVLPKDGNTRLMFGFRSIRQ